MRILISLYKYFPYGGLQRDAMRFAKAAAEAGHRVIFLVSSWKGEKKISPESGISVVECGPMPGFSNIARMDAFECHARRLIDGGCCDVSLAMNRIGGHDFYFAADACQKMELLERHGRFLCAINPRWRGIVRQEDNVFGMHSRTVIFTIAEFQKRDFQKAYSTPDERIVALPPGIEKSMLYPGMGQAGRIRRNIRRELGVGDSMTMGILVGSNFLRKGIDRAIAAVAALPEQLRRNFRLYVIGKNDERPLMKCMEKLHLEKECVVIVPPSSRVHEFMLAADVMIHPARSEGAPTVLAEAMANHLPVICTDICGFYSKIRAAGGIVIASPFEQKALNDALKQVAEDVPGYRAAAEKFALGEDFCGRAAVAVRVMEEFFSRRKKVEKTQCSLRRIPYLNDGWNGICKSDYLADFSNVDEIIENLPAQAGTRVCQYRMMGKLVASDGTLCFVKLLWGCGDDRGSLFNFMKWYVRPSRALAVEKNTRLAHARGVDCAEILLAARKRRHFWSVPVDILVSRGAEGIQLSCMQKDGHPRLEQAMGIAARKIAFMHRAGFVHGDCLPGNLFVDYENSQMCFIDNDRTAPCCRLLLPHASRRNIVQFLAHSTVTDDMCIRFLREYAGEMVFDQQMTREFIDAMTEKMKSRRKEIFESVKGQS